MTIVPMDTTNAGLVALNGHDITIRITIETLATGPYNMEYSITLLAGVQAALTLTNLVTSLGPGSSLHCLAWYTGIFTGMTFPPPPPPPPPPPGRYEGGGLIGPTSIAGVARPIHPSLGTNPLRGWPAKRHGPPGHPAAAALGVDRLVVTPSAAAVAQAVTGRSHCRCLPGSIRNTNSPALSADCQHRGPAYNLFFKNFN